MSDKKEQIVAKAVEGKSEKAKHTHPVILVGKFKRQEQREPEHRKGSRK